MSYTFKLQEEQIISSALEKSWKNVFFKGLFVAFKLYLEIRLEIMNCFISYKQSLSLKYLDTKILYFSILKKYLTSSNLLISYKNILF